MESPGKTLDRLDGAQRDAERRDRAKAYDEACAAWPDVTLEREEFMRHVHALGDEVAAEHIADVFLACACLRGDPRALVWLERQFLSQIPLFLARIERDADAIAEVQQALREKLLVAPIGGRARLADYTGQGSLGGWLRVVAVRAALDRKRVHRPHLSSDDVPDAVLTPSVDPELDVLRQRYAAEFREAFQTALLSLDSRSRTILRLHVLDGLNVEKIGLIYDVHRATVARWIADTRTLLFDRTRDALSMKLALPASEFESVVRLVGSELDASVRRLLTDDVDQR